MCTSVLLIVSIAASRVYLGVHWFSDVTAGLIVGSFFLLGVDVLLGRQHTRHPCGLMDSGGDTDTDTGAGDSLDDELDELVEAGAAADRR